MEKRVLLAFSGGIDSCSSALRLRDQGYEVTLLALDMTGDPAMATAARLAARSLDMPLHIKDVRDIFRSRIVNYFTAAYLNGETPAPCTRCNPQIKWETLYDMAVADGYDHIATGHYFGIHEDNGIRYVQAAVDRGKDQSYYLWGLPQSCLRIALTPMGDCLKSEVRETLPRSLQSRESMGVCFLGGRSYADFLKEHIPGIEPGEIEDSAGRVIGRHDGCAFYTIGQKRGLGLPPSYAVTRIDIRRNRLTAGPDNELFHSYLIVRDANIPDGERLCASANIRVKVRGIGRNPEGYARIRNDSGRIHVTLESPAWAAAPGQPVVFYEGDLVLGGGYLDSCF